MFVFFLYLNTSYLVEIDKSNVFVQVKISLVERE